ncbi:predicted DNA-binding transcriptional regulator YafY [Jatrophihabitans sp. GAS493]|uniref:helix-turn-helix transcriptional regulator n=1 Tax=Jatrophihabitans sp. GAS493 TaxID=1907575 RepID=UPI000BB8760B|nr:YafY family protein [Jatrophihabitans sp. GAS493]SOD70871.1 predicted DNA-binding transcriptional regulator YafY [Jatrophihabitans sp. GAS493]
MRADRLLAILLTLQGRGMVSARELAQRLEVSTRTIYRDVDALSAAGVPVYCEQGRSGGVRLLDGYQAKVPALTPEESMSLFVLTSQRTHADLGLGDALASAMSKLLAAVPQSQRSDAERAGLRILADPRPWMKPGDEVPQLALVQRVVLNDLRLHITYRHGRSERVSRYTLDPYGLVAKAGVWYLVADSRRAARLFRVSRMLEATELNEPVRRRSTVTLEQLWSDLSTVAEQRPTEVSAVVRVVPAALGRIRRITASYLVAEDPVTDVPGKKGQVDITLQFNHIWAARGLLLGFGADVEVLSPPELREEMRRCAEEVQQLYS